MGRLPLHPRRLERKRRVSLGSSQSHRAAIRLGAPGLDSETWETANPLPSDPYEFLRKPFYHSYVPPLTISSVRSTTKTRDRHKPLPASSSCGKPGFTPTEL